MTDVDAPQFSFGPGRPERCPEGRKSSGRRLQRFSGQPFLLEPTLHPAEFQQAPRPFEMQLERLVGAKALLQSSHRRVEIPERGMRQTAAAGGYGQGPVPADRARLALEAAE